MEYCINNVQTIRCQTESFCENELVAILKDLAIALSDLHSNSIVHLDVKPGTFKFYFKTYIFIHI